MKNILAGLMAISIAASGMGVVSYADEYIIESGQSILSEMYGTLDRTVEIGEKKTISVGFEYSSINDIKLTISGDKCVKLVKKSGTGKKKVNIKLKGVSAGQCKIRIINTKTGKSVTLNITVNSTESNKDEYINKVFELVNEEREKEGLDPLILDDTLCKAADVRAKEVGKYYSHERPNGTKCFTVLGEYDVSYSYAGENIAQGQSDGEGVMDSWMHSKLHKANILGENFTKIGIGYDPSTNSWVQIFIG